MVKGTYQVFPSARPIFLLLTSVSFAFRKPIESFKTDLASVTAADVTNLATKILKTPLTLAAIGNGKFLLSFSVSFKVSPFYSVTVGAVPPLSIVASHFG